MTQTTQSPALIASQSSYGASSPTTGGWLALMAGDVVIEDPIGKSVTNPDGSGIMEAVGAFVRHTRLTVTCGIPIQLTGRDRPFWCCTASLTAALPVACSPTG